jgi:hypothetical protein
MKKYELLFQNALFSMRKCEDGAFSCTVRSKASHRSGLLRNPTERSDGFRSGADLAPKLSELSDFGEFFAPKLSELSDFGEIFAPLRSAPIGAERIRGALRSEN